MLPNSEHANHQKLCTDGPSAHASPCVQNVIVQWYESRLACWLPLKLLIANGLERWQSGRMRRFAKPLYGLTPVPRVRIPPSPPDVLTPVSIIAYLTFSLRSITLSVVSEHPAGAY